MSRPVVMLYEGYWPFGRKAVLAPGACDYAAEIMSHGRFAFSLPGNAAIDDSDLAPDALVGIRYPPLPDFAGMVEEVTEEPMTGQVRVAGREYAAALSQRLTPQGASWPSGDAGLIAERLFRHANSRNPTGIEIASVGRGAIMADVIQAQGDNLQAFFERLTERTGYEWRMTYDCGQRLRVRWEWSDSVGVDLRTMVHVTAVADPSYTRTLYGRQSLVRAVGGTLTFADRPSMARVIGGAAPFHNELASTITTRPTSAQQVSVMHAPETDMMDARASTSRAVADKTQAALSQPWVFEEQIEFALPVSRWTSGVGVGAILGLRLGSVRLGAGIVRPVRILGYQVSGRDGTVTVIGGVMDG